MVDFTVTLVPAGNTTLREISALQQEVQSALQRVRGVERVAAVRAEAPGGAKGVADVIGALFVGVPPGLISGVFDVIKAVLTRPAQPMTEVEINGGDIKLKFDPKTVSLAQMEEFVGKLRTQTGVG